MTGVLIVSSHPLFGQGLEILLSQQAGIELLGFERGVQALNQRIEELNPDVVLIDCSVEDAGTVAALKRFLMGKARTRIISLNLHDNCLCVYSAEQRVVREVRDLMEVIKTSCPPSVSDEGMASSRLSE